MKRTLFFLAVITVGIAIVSCNKNTNEGEEQQVAQIAIYSPDDLEEFDLEYDNQDKSLTFEWESDDPTATYSILFSLSEDMSATEAIEVGTETTRDVTHAEFDEILGALGVKEYNGATLYWAIQGTTAAGNSMSEVRSMDLFRFYKPFVDPRDNEEYRVCRVEDALTGDYAVWLADNMRATVYADGTAIGAEGVRFYGDNPDDGTMTDMKDIYGGYYTWTAAVRDVASAESGTQVQGVCPDGWHMPSKDEWDFLINGCTDEDEPGTALKEASYWDANATNVGKNSIGFNMAGAGYIWEPLTNRIDDEGMNTYFWTATAPKEGDVYPWDPPVADFPTQGVTYGFAANDFGAALYPYNRGRGFSVRCVLDLD